MFWFDSGQHADSVEKRGLTILRKAVLAIGVVICLVLFLETIGLSIFEVAGR